MNQKYCKRSISLKLISIFLITLALISIIYATGNKGKGNSGKGSGKEKENENEKTVGGPCWSDSGENCYSVESNVDDKDKCATSNDEKIKFSYTINKKKSCKDLSHFTIPIGDCEIPDYLIDGLTIKIIGKDGKICSPKKSDYEFGLVPNRYGENCDKTKIRAFKLDVEGNCLKDDKFTIQFIFNLDKNKCVCYKETKIYFKYATLFNYDKITFPDFCSKCKCEKKEVCEYVITPKCLPFEQTPKYSRRISN